MTIQQLIDGMSPYTRVEIINTTTLVIIQARVGKMSGQSWLTREIDEWTWVPTSSHGTNKLRILVSGNSEDDILSWEG